MTRYTAPNKPAVVPPQIYIDQLHTEINEMLKTIKFGASIMQQQDKLITELMTEIDRWRKIAMFNIEAQGYDNPQQHIETCYADDGTYHGGA